jgi:hypothetical protein
MWMGLVKCTSSICINLGTTLKSRKHVPWMMEITEFDAFVYNAYIAFPSAPLAHVSKTTLTSVANVIMLLFLLTKVRRGGGICRRVSKGWARGKCGESWSVGLFHGVGVGGGEPSASCLRRRTHGIGASGTYWTVGHLASGKQESIRPFFVIHSVHW